MAMSQILGNAGNASSLHGSGRRARRQLEESRESIAASLGGRPSEVIFTGGGTESDNLAVKGIIAIKAMSDLSSALGHSDDATRYAVSSRCSTFRVSADALLPLRRP